jgi:hypothetical protein
MRALPPIDDVVVLVAQMRAPIARQRRGVGIGGADPEVRRPAVDAADHAPVGTPGLPDPIVTGGCTLSELGLRRLRQVDRQPRRFVPLVCPVRPAAPAVIVVLVPLGGEEVGEVGLRAVSKSRGRGDQ